MLTTRPKPASAILRSTAWVTWSGPIRLISTTLRHSSASVSRNGFASSQPALFTRPPIGPAASANAPTASSTAGASVMSTS